MFLTITVGLLILAIFMLVFTTTNKKPLPYQYPTKNILIITTGDDFNTEIEKIHKYFNNDLHYEVKSINVSKDVSPNDWNTLAEAIFNNYNQYDAFLVLHHPDTLAYTGSALSFILESLNKTVVLTTNAILGLRLLQNYRIPEVVIVDDNGDILRACRSKRLKNNFTSLSYPPLGTIDDDIELNDKLILPPPNEPLKMLPISGKKVVLVKVYPGMKLLDTVQNQKIYGLVLESYDQTLPDDIDTIKALQQSGTIVVSVSQSSGTVLNDSGDIISCGNMTGESALAKLNLIVSHVKGYNTGMVRQLMQKSMRGEI